MSRLQTNTIDFNDSELHAVLINHTRYCLTRSSYAVSDCCDLLRSKWAQIPVNTQTIIRRDIKEAIDSDEEMIELENDRLVREPGTTPRYYSMDKSDRLSWERILESIDRSH